MTSGAGLYSLLFRYGLFFGLWAVAAIFSLPTQAQAPTNDWMSVNQPFQIPAQTLAESLILFAKQSGGQVTVNSEWIAGKQAPAVQGSMTAHHALELLLAQSGLGYEQVGTMVRIMYKARNPKPAKLPKIAPVIVTARAVEPVYTAGNMDLPRSPDGVQPYVIIAREALEASGDTAVEDVFAQVLPMSTAQTNRTANGWTGTSSQIDLRGLGASHTLVLINGRRRAGVGIRGTAEASDQQNINTIPLAAIERIEVLPASASAIYGSNAIGGVINVVLRQDFTGTEVNLHYGNTFDSDQANQSGALVSGFALEDGRTQILISGQQQTSNALLLKDRRFAQEARQLTLRNNPAAIYGMQDTSAVAPPYGALVNVRSVDGSPLFPQLSEASFTHIPAGYAGWHSDGVEPLIANLGSYNLDLSSGIGAFSGVKNLIGESNSHALSLAINRYFTDQLQVFLDLGGDASRVAGAGNYHGFGVVTVPASAPNNPFDQAVYVAYPANYADGIAQQQRIASTNATHGTLGINWQITPTWLLNADYSYSNARIDLSYQRSPDAAIEAYQLALANGNLDVLRDVTQYPTDISAFWTRAPNFSDQTLRDYNIRAVGTVFSNAAGAAQLVTAIEQRDLNSDSRAEMRLINDPVTPITQRKQTVRAIYAELTLPLIAPDMHLPWLHQMSMHVGARHEQFAINAVDRRYSASSPTLGFSITPVAPLLLRAAYSEGFVSPNISQLTPPSVSGLPVTVTDPLRGNEQITFYPLTSGNPDLEPESSRNINSGFVYSPKSIPTLRFSMDYYQIKKSNNITSLSAQTIVDDVRYHDQITRAPSTADDEYSLGQITQVYSRYFNATWLDTRGVDSNLAFTNETRVGRVNLNLGYTYVDRYLQQDTVGATPVSYLARTVSSDISAPLRHRINASMQLKMSAQWNLGWTLEHYDSYRLTDAETIRNQGSNTIPSQTFHSVFAQYNIGAPRASVDSLQFTLGIKNLFNTYQLDLSESDYLSRYADARLRQYYFNIKSVF